MGSWDRESVLAESTAWTWMPPGTPHVATEEYLVVAYPSWFLHPTTARVLGSSRPATDLVDEVHAHARALGRHELSWVVSDTTRPPGLEPVLLGRGAQVVERSDILALPLDNGVPDVGAPTTVTVRDVVDEVGLRDAYDVEAQAFGAPRPSDGQVTAGLAELRAGLADESAGRVVAYLDGRPAATGGWTRAGRVVRLWGAGTAPWARRRGAYRAVLDARLRRAVALGLDLGLAHGRVGTSSPILRRAGFTRYGEQRILHLDLGS